MTTVRKLIGLFSSWLFLFSFLACDYYEAPPMILEEEIYIESDDALDNTKLIDQDKITLYQVDDEDIIKIQDYEVAGELIEFQKDTAKHQEIWELVKKIIPSDYRGKMNQFLIYHGAKTKTSGFVDPTINSLSKWQLAIAIDYAYRKPFNSNGELAFTIVHEFGHILTLNNEQVNAGVIKKNCSNYFVNNGCANSNAYINTFHNHFWEDIVEEFNNLEKTQEASTSFYSKYIDRFVSQYSATSPMEDIADIFATFVTESQMREGTSIADQKIQMMYDSAEFKYLRDYIRQQGAVAKKSDLVTEGNRENSFSCLAGSGY